MANRSGRQEETGDRSRESRREADGHIDGHIDDGSRVERQLRFQALGKVLRRGEKAVHLVRSVLASRPLSWSSWVLRSNLPLSRCRTL